MVNMPWAAGQRRREAELARLISLDPGLAQTFVGDGHCLKARDLWLSYDGSTYVLRGVDINVERGALTMILGRSGSGKTSLLKVLKGLIKPQRGWVHVLGSAGSNGQGPHCSVAYVPQTLGLVRSMTALENALAGALGRTGILRTLVKAFPRSTVEEAKDILASLGLAHKTYETVYNLSGGERQRVAIARALMQRPALILADEFVSQLDPITAEEILVMMRGIAGQGVSLLITTHETDVVANYADRVVVMSQGRIIHDGAAAHLTMAEMLDLLR